MNHYLIQDDCEVRECIGWYVGCGRHWPNTILFSFLHTLAISICEGHSWDLHRYPSPQMLSPLYKIMQCLHITYGTSFLYFKSSLDYLQYLIQCKIYGNGKITRKKSTCSVQTIFSQNSWLNLQIKTLADTDNWPYIPRSMPATFITISWIVQFLLTLLFLQTPSKDFCPIGDYRYR